MREARGQAEGTVPLVILNAVKDPLAPMSGVVALLAMRQPTDVAAPARGRVIASRRVRRVRSGQTCVVAVGGVDSAIPPFRVSVIRH